MSRWTSRTLVSAEPADVRDLLTDPLAATRWSPLPFRVESLDGPRLTEATEEIQRSLGGGSTMPGGFSGAFGSGAFGSGAFGSGGLGSGGSRLGAFLRGN